LALTWKYKRKTCCLHHLETSFVFQTFQFF
jgi:hypothetical protein